MPFARESILPRTAEVVVIGGGCVGATVAYYLTRLGVRDIVLLERSALASGPTGRSVAQLLARSEHPVVAKLKWDELQFFRNFERFLSKEDKQFIQAGNAEQPVEGVLP